MPPYGPPIFLFERIMPPYGPPIFLFERSLRLFMVNPNTLNGRLKKWAAIQHLAFIDAKLKFDRVEMLEDAGFDWFPPGKQQEDQAHWQMVLHEVIQYQHKYPNKHLNPLDGTRVYSWLFWLRYKYQKGTLSQTRFCRRRSSGFAAAPATLVQQAMGVNNMVNPHQPALVLHNLQPVAFFSAATVIAWAIFAIIALAFHM
ncbi:hypothetical protein MPSEU_001006900 [Mayamaea pseudoterrestris]|nr:hypothetical protein MPSEU_001006900 [Mayamaea pseudoterrestris]